MMIDNNIKELTKEAVLLLRQLIATPSFSSEEDRTAMLLAGWFTQKGIAFEQEK